MAKFCQACGASIANESAPFCDKCGTKLALSQPGSVLPNENKKESTLNSAIKWGAICCGGIILLSVISAFIFGMAGNVSSSSPTAQPSSITLSPTIDVKNIGKPTVKTTVITTTAQSSIPTEIELAIGQMASNPERQVTPYSTQKVSSYTVTFSNYPIITHAKSGKIFIFIDTEIKNIGSDRIYASAGDFSMGDSEGNRYDPEMYSGDDSFGYFKELYKTQKMRGKILFEVPQNAKNLKLYYDFGNLFSGINLASWPIN